MTAPMIEVISLFDGEFMGTHPVSLNPDHVTFVAENNCGNAIIYLSGGDAPQMIAGRKEHYTPLEPYALREDFDRRPCDLPIGLQQRLWARTAILVGESRASVVAKINAARAAARITVIRTEGGAA